jgi:hypothetical protein
LSIPMHHKGRYDALNGKPNQPPVAIEMVRPRGLRCRGGFEAAGDAEAARVDFCVDIRISRHINRVELNRFAERIRTFLLVF